MIGGRRDAPDADLRHIVAHELRAPLVAMRNLADVVDSRWDELSEEQRRCALRTTAQEASRLLEIIDAVTGSGAETTESRA